MTDGASVEENGKRFQVNEQVFDHAVDAVAAGGIAATALGGVASETVVLGLVSIALGKRVLKSAAA
jgi:hypothetical protein